LAAVPVSRLAPVPGPVSDAQAAGLATAGLTALRALELGGLLVGKRVLITGATGGVGRIAVQLAHLSGAIVTALVRDAAASAALLGRLGATSVVEHIAPRGVVVNLATPPGAGTVSFRAARFDRAYGARIYTLNLPDELTAHASGTSDLTRLCTLAARRQLDAQIGLECSWREAGAAIDALLNRSIGGKAVLHVD
jgi:NADPH:quinone reductase